jgi:GNAT superfamily N-acetyltransferase
MTIDYAWRGPFTDDEVEPLHAEAFDRPTLADPGWRTQVDGHSLGWVTARVDAGELIGFVNVAWDGGVHAFVLDTIVAAAFRRRGIATALVAIAEREARAVGCEWLHVDFEPHLTTFYLEACGFRSTPAGVIELRVAESAT